MAFALHYGRKTTGGSTGMRKMWWARLHLFHSRLILVILAVVAASCTAVPAFADPIVITGGGISLPAIWTGLDPPFGWTLTGSGTSLGGITFAQDGGALVNVGDPINLSSTIGVSASPFRTGPFSQTVNGVTYNSVFLSGTLNFSATPGRVTSADTTTGFQTPFTMDGSVSLFQGDPAQPFSPGALLFTSPMTGRGTASMSLFPRAGAFVSFGVSYTFADPAPDPTPEPATLALLGGGLVVAVGRARRKRR